MLLKSTSKHREFFRFVVVGVISTAVHYGLYLVLKLYVNYNISYSVGYFMALLLNFYLSSVFTFNEKPTFNKFLGMSAAHFINFLLHLGLLNLFVYIGLSKNIAPLPVYVIAVPINFVLVRFVFKYRKNQ